MPPHTGIGTQEKDSMKKTFVLLCCRVQSGTLCAHMRFFGGPKLASDRKLSQLSQCTPLVATNLRAPPTNLLQTKLQWSFSKSRLIGLGSGFGTVCLFEVPYRRWTFSKLQTEPKPEPIGLEKAHEAQSTSILNMFTVNIWLHYLTVNSRLE